MMKVVKCKDYTIIIGNRMTKNTIDREKTKAFWKARGGILGGFISFCAGLIIFSGACQEIAKFTSETMKREKLQMAGIMLLAIYLLAVGLCFVIRGQITLLTFEDSKKIDQLKSTILQLTERVDQLENQRIPTISES